MKGLYAGIGSRNAPQHTLEVMEELGYVLYHAGWGLCSGHAYGSDQAFERGARKAAEELAVEDLSESIQIFLPWNGFNQAKHNPREGFYDATQLADYGCAKRLALKARGSDHGLGEAGVKLHTRNAFQILGKELNSPVKRVFFWAPPLQGGKQVKGGTNTAYQLARDYGIVYINLYYDWGMRITRDVLHQCTEKFLPNQTEAHRGDILE